MSMALTVTFDDGRTETVMPAPGDLVRFERQYQIPAAKLGDEASMEHMLFIAWSALTRQGKESRDFDSFLDALAEVGDAAPLPTPPPLS